MKRSEVFRATGPTMASYMRIKVGMCASGRIVAGDATLAYLNGAYPSDSVAMGAMSAFACYDMDAVRTIGHNVVGNRPKQAAYRAPGAPIAAYAVESVIDELCQSLSLDPLEVRRLNAAREGTLSSYGPTYGPIGLGSVLDSVASHPHYQAPLAPGIGRGLACGFWFNFGGASSVGVAINLDGTVTVTEGNPDIGGSRASIGMMVAETLGIAYEQVRVQVADTASLGYNETTDGSRVTFAVGKASIQAARSAISVLCARAAAIWGIEAEAVVWEEGSARPAGDNAGRFAPLSLQEIAATSHQTGGPIAGHCEAVAEGAGVSFGAHLADVAVDPETGETRVVRYTVFQDAGKAIHPDYVEGQMQGGAVQGIGWALNEAYHYGKDGRLENPSFLDYRMPVASDVPMIDTRISEVPNPGHPFGVRGVGETPIVPPLAAINNAVSRAVDRRFHALPLSPPHLVSVLKSPAA